MAAKGTFKVEFLKELERKVQAEWEEARVFEEDAPQKPDPSSKYMVTFPFPYMNGLLHLGHTFTITRVSESDHRIVQCTLHCTAVITCCFTDPQTTCTDIFLTCAKIGPTFLIDPQFRLHRS